MNNFIYFFDVVKSYKEYIFPAIMFFTLGLAAVVLFKIINKKLKLINWIILVSLGIIIILSGNRILFVISKGSSGDDILQFILNGINLYTFVFSCEICFLISGILNYFDIKYLKK